MDAQWRALLPPRLRELPADLAATITLTAVTIAVVLLPGVKETPLRIGLGLPFVLFLPGYAFVAALFPEAGDPLDDRPDGLGAEEEADVEEPDADDGDGRSGLGFTPWRPTADDEDGEEAPPHHTTRWRRGIDGIERVALSFGLSIAIVPLLGLALNFTPWGIRLVPILVTVGGFTICSAVVAAERRRQLPAEERFGVPYRSWIAAGRAELFEPDDSVDAALNVVLVLSVLLAVGSVGYAVAVPTEGESFSEFYLLTDGEDEELVAADYPEELVVGEPAPLVVGIGNEEHSSEDYTVVVQLQEVELVNGMPPDSAAAEVNGTNATEVIVEERQELDRFSVELSDGDTWHHRHDVVAPGMAGEDRRLKYLLYRGEPPANATAETAYRDLHLWVDVSESTSAGSTNSS